MNASKCKLGSKSVTFLGSQVSGEGTEPLAEKVIAVNSYPLPKTENRYKDLRKFKGILNFYRRFLPNAAAQQSSLQDLLKNNLKGNTPLSWMTETEQAFQTCKQSKAALLAHPTPDPHLAISYTTYTL